MHVKRAYVLYRSEAMRMIHEKCFTRCLFLAWFIRRAARCSVITWEISSRASQYPSWLGCHVIAKLFFVVFN